MVVDTTRCVSCNNCSIACKVENNLPDGVWWNKAVTVGGEEMYTPAGEYPNNLSMKFYTYACQHCETPACVAVCPTESTHKRDDGIIYQDYESCIGCKLCLEACPYTGVRTFNETAPQYFLDFAVGDADVLPHQEKVVEKCTFCFHRIDRGERPACVDICRALARFFGDLDDPESEVSKLIASRPYYQLLTERGTGPSIYFLE
jgi:molybdopterin-containing oxidoreductase family iron-sulfur binding subunit